MKRVCILCESWESGGIEAFLYNIISHMDRSELEIDLVAAQLGKSIFTQPLQDLGVQFYQLSGNTRKILENHRLYRNILAKRHYDVLHLNVYQGLSLAYLRLAREMNVPVRIAHSHNTAFRESLTKPLKLIIHNLARMKYTKEATALWACSKSAAEFLFAKEELDKKKYTFIPNGIDTKRFRFNQEMRKTVRAELQLEEKFVIGNVGRLCFQKNQEFLLEIFSEVKKKKPDSCLLIVGEGDYLQSLKNKAHLLGIGDSVIFYGVSAHIEELLWAMDVFVFPSRFEGFGIAIIEAKAAGLPVVVSAAVPGEVLIDSSVQSLPLESGKEKWAEHILNLPPAFGREHGAEEVKKAGFDIAAIAKNIASKIEGGSF